MIKYIKFISKIHFIIGKKNTFDLYKIILLILFATILEVFGITLIIPAFNFLLDPDKILITIDETFNNEIISNILTQAKSLSLKDIGIVIFGLIFFVFTFKFFYLLFVAWISSKFVLDIQKYVTQKLFKNYINRDYDFFLKSNSSLLSSYVLKESSVFAGTVMSSVITILTEGSMIIGFVILILLFNPQLSIIIISITTLIVASYYFFIRKKVNIWGKRRQEHDALKLKNLYQSLENIKIIKFLGLENFFKKKFYHHNSIATDMDRNAFFLSKVPNIGLEYLVLILLVISVAVIFLSSVDTNELITQLALYAAVAFKMLPSITRSLNSLTGLKYGVVVVDLLHKELNQNILNKSITNLSDENKKNKTEISFQNEIELKKINFSYEKNDRKILDDVFFKIKKNEFVGIIGESGSGKTTFLNIFLTLLNFDSGEYLVDKKKISRENNIFWRSRISFVPQEPYLIDDTLIKNVAFGIEDDLINIDQVKMCLDTAQFNIKEKNLNTIIGEKGVQLSGGQKQRILIARALYNNPDIIVMDEPTSSLDVDTEQRIIQSINKLSENKTIILVSHRKTVLQKCNKIFELKEGKLSNINETN